jgi:PAS domain S-box-containing protein
MHGQMIEPQDAKQSIYFPPTAFLIGGFSKREIRDPEYMHAQQALKESVWRFGSLLESAELIAIKLNAQGELTYCNKFFLQLTGWRREEILGRSWCDLFIPPGQFSSELYMAQLATGFVYEQWESEILTKDRLPRMISWFNRILLNSAAKPIGSASVGLSTAEIGGDQAQLRQVVQTFAKYLGDERHEFHSRAFEPVCHWPTGLR